MKEHNFTHAKKIGLDGSEYMVIYCTKCGQVSFNQAKNDEQRPIKECNYMTPKALSRGDFVREVKELAQKYKITVHESDQYDSEEDWCGTDYHLKFNGVVDYSKEAHEYFIN